MKQIKLVSIFVSSYPNIYTPLAAKNWLLNVCDPNNDTSPLGRIRITAFAPMALPATAIMNCVDAGLNASGNVPML
jgi:hypothetical protein